MAKTVSGMSAESAAQRIRHLEKLVDDAGHQIAALQAKNAALIAERDKALSRLALLKKLTGTKRVKRQKYGRS
ncbi:hypothetical protein [Enterobacter soli]|uniref:hypothetical protein n=1 Tax=Enterobacter soli TaxID=885040 RepID=UPI002F412B25